MSTNFGKIIKKLRESKKILQTELAIELGVSRSTIGFWENEKIEPNIEMLEKIADYFKVDINYLLGYPTDKEIAFKQGLQDLQLERYKHLSEDDKELLADQFNALIDRLEKK